MFLLNQLHTSSFQVEDLSTDCHCMNGDFRNHLLYSSHLLCSDRFGFHSILFATNIATHSFTVSLYGSAIM